MNADFERTGAKMVLNNNAKAIEEIIECGTRDLFMKKFEISSFTQGANS